MKWAIRSQVSLKEEKGSTTTQSILKYFNTMKKWARMGYMIQINVSRRYSLNLQETVRSMDKEPYDNISWDQILTTN